VPVSARATICGGTYTLPVDTCESGASTVIIAVDDDVLALFHLSTRVYATVYTPDAVPAGTTIYSPERVSPDIPPLFVIDISTPDSVAVDPLYVSPESRLCTPPLPYI
jgi:hypothetical protein